jgi:putative ABC transport system permease protein
MTNKNYTYGYKRSPSHERMFQFVIRHSSFVNMFTQTWQNLAANKTRSFLTMFGISWGLICLILMTSMGEGMWVAQEQKARALGQNIIIVWGGMTSKGNDAVRAGKITRLTLDDYMLLKQKATYLQRSSPEIQRSLPTRSNINNGTFRTHGVFPDYMQMRTIDVKPGGRQINPGDNENALRVCIIGDEVRDQLFNKSNAVGQTIMIGGFPYLIIGELVPKDQNSNYSGPDKKKIFVPFYSMSRDFPLPRAVDGKHELSNLILQPSSAEVGEAAELQARQILGAEMGFDYRDQDALQIWNTVKEAKFMKRIFDALRIFLGTVAIVTLILGGVGVMNIMLLSVGERTREIGICKAVGATTRRILMQFFAESMMLTLSAGLSGILIGWGLCGLINKLPKIDFFAGMIVTPEVGVIAFGFLALVGVLSSIYPAFMAAVVDPIEALRFE